MVTKKPIYEIKTFAEESTFNHSQLLQILDALPLSVNTAEGHNLSLNARTEKISNPKLLVDYLGAQVISLRPQKGMRLEDACMYGPFAKAFVPSRIMDEGTGGGACCSYHANTTDLGLPFNHDFTIDIYKLG